MWELLFFLNHSVYPFKNTPLILHDFKDPFRVFGALKVDHIEAYLYMRNLIRLKVVYLVIKKALSS